MITIQDLRDNYDKGLYDTQGPLEPGRIPVSPKHQLRSDVHYHLRGKYRFDDHAANTIWTYVFQHYDLSPEYFDALENYAAFACRLLNTTHDGEIEW